MMMMMMIYEILKQTGIPAELVRLIKVGTSLNIIYLKE
jgi:hypothetical protein